MATIHTNVVPNIADLPKPKPGESLQVIEASGNLAQYVMRHIDGKSTYLGIASSAKKETK